MVKLFIVLVSSVVVIPLEQQDDKNPRVPRPINVELRVGCIELIDDKKPKVPRPAIVEFRFVAVIPPPVEDDQTPKVPRPFKVEFRFVVAVAVAAVVIELSPATVEFKVGCTVDKKPRVPRPVTVEFIFEFVT